jgi:hypothetical protein
LSPFFFLEEQPTIFPDANELTRLYVVHESRVGIDPLNFPPISANMLENFYMFETRTQHWFVPKSVFAARFDLPLQHGIKA